MDLKVGEKVKHVRNVDGVIHVNFVEILMISPMRGGRAKVKESYFE